VVYYIPSMLEFQEKRKLKSFLYSRIMLIVLFILIIFAFNAVWNVYKKQMVTRNNLAKTSTNLAGLQAREKMLSSVIERLKTESGTEAEIREKYGLVKPGEEVIVIVDKDSDSNFKDTPPPTGFWQKILEWFK